MKNYLSMWFCQTMVALSVTVIAGGVGLAQTTGSPTKGSSTKTGSAKKQGSVSKSGSGQKNGSDKKSVDAKGSDTKDGKSPLAFSVGGGQLNFEVSGDWKSVPPRSRILEYEIKVPKSDGDPKDGRLTIMRAGGSLAANVKRWEGQFRQPDGSATAAKESTEMVSGMEVKMVDISGTYIETMGGGPFSGGKKVANEDYRVLAAIIQTKELGNYFLKLVGPQKTVEANKKHFESMIKGLKLKN